MGATTKKNEKVFLPSPPLTVTKVGYVAIFGSGDCFGRTLADYPILYEARQECEADAKEGTGFVAIAKVIWEELA